MRMIQGKATAMQGKFKGSNGELKDLKLRKTREVKGKAKEQQGKFKAKVGKARKAYGDTDIQGKLKEKLRGIKETQRGIEES